MKRLFKYLPGQNLFLLFLVALSVFSGEAYSQQQIQKGVLRVKVTEAYATKLQQTTANGRQTFSVLNTGSAKLNEANTRFRATSMKRVFPDAGKFEGKHRKYGLHLWYEVRIDSTLSLSTAYETYRRVPEIQRVDSKHNTKILDYDRINYEVLPPSEIRNVPVCPDGSEISNDPLLDKQWHYNNYGQTKGTVGVDIDLLKAWTIEAGKKEVIVAIVDGGIEASHPDLKDNMWVNEDEIPGNGVDDDNNGFVDDIHGFSFVDWRATIKPNPHGTHVAGTVAAVNNNGIGVSGVAGGTGKGDGVRLMSCGVYKELMPGLPIGGGFENAYVYAADNGAVISQNSWGYNDFGAYDQTVLDAIDYFIAEAGTDENGIQTGPMKGGIVIFSAGNNGHEGLMYPACYDQTFAVASLTHDNIRANYSNYGDWVDIIAPGGEAEFVREQGVLSTFIDGGYAYLQGTSMAAPHVSGTAALLVSRYGGPGFTPAMIRERITSTTMQVYNDNPDYLGKLGAGRINAFHALIEKHELTGPSTINDLQVKSKTSTTLTLKWTAPYDEGCQSVSYYEIRYSTQPITPANFQNATYAPNPIKTGPKGATETFVISNLLPQSTYYVAVVSYDMFRNASPLSNVVQVLTPQPEPQPTLVINPFPLKFEMMPLDTVVKEVLISNPGLANLNYSIEPTLWGPLMLYKILTFSKLSGTVPPGQTDTLLLTFNPRGFTGTVEEWFPITSDDPIGTISWPLQITFLETKGKPAFNVDKVEFGKTMVGTNGEKMVFLRSTGTKPVTVVNASVDNPDFSATINNFFSLATYDTMGFRIFFRPSSKGVSTGVLTIRTDDSEYPVLTLPLSGEGTPAPDLQISVDTLSAALKTNEAVTRQITLHNTGESEMTYSILEKGPIVESRKVLIICPDAAATGTSILLTTDKVSADIHQNPGALKLEDLVSYDVVIVTNNRPWNWGGISREHLGNVLADYIDGGGKVIMTQHYYYDFDDFESEIGGRFLSENYAPFISDMSYYPSKHPTLGEIVSPKHPLLDGVKNLQYNVSMQKVKLTPGAAGISKWSNGEWMLAANSNVVALNFTALGTTASSEVTSGDLAQLYHNAIQWLAGSTYLSTQPSRGTIAPGGSVVVDVAINAEKLQTGLYQSALTIATNVPDHGQQTIPIGMMVSGPKFVVEPGALSLTAKVGQQTTQSATLRNEGTEAFPYAITTEKTRTLTHVVADSIGTKFYSTGFGGFDVKRFRYEEVGWSDSGRWYIDTVSASSGKQHLAYTSNGLRDLARIISPAIEHGTGKSFCSAKIKIEGSGTSFSVSPLGFPSASPVTTLTFGGDGTVRVVIYNTEMEYFDVKPVKYVVPDGYFEVSFELDPTTSVFNVYIDGSLVFTGTAPLTTINALAFESDNRWAGQHLYIDDVIVRQGPAESVPEFLEVSPASGVLQAGEEISFAVKADASELSIGEYSSNVVAKIGNGIERISLPVSFAVTGGSSLMNVSQDEFRDTIDYHSFETRYFEVANRGGEPFEFTVNVPEEAQSWLSVEPAAGTVPALGIAVIKVRYNSESLEAGAYSSVISIGSDASNLKSKTIETSLVVRDPAVLIIGPPFITLELIQGDQLDFPLTFTNGGWSALQLTIDNKNDTWLSFDTTMQVLSPRGGRTVLPIRITTEDLSAGVYNTTLDVYTNDPVNSLVQVPVQLTLIAAPALTLSTDSIKISIEQGKSATQSLTLGNSGEAALGYMINTQRITNPTMYHGGPNGFGYTFIDTREPGGPKFKWNDISTTGVEVTLGEFDSVTVDLPFAFPFYGEEKHEVKISSDGFLAFNTVGFLPTRSPDDRNLFNAKGPNTVIAAHWDDLDPTRSGTIHYKIEPDRFIVQFTHVSINTFGWPTEPALQNTFQIVLHNDGAIDMHYLDIMNWAGQLVGIGGADPNDALIAKNVFDTFSADSTSIFFAPMAPWMNAEFQSSSLTGGEQNVADIEFDATDLEEGIYQSTLYITSNDRHQPVKRIPVKMNVQKGQVTSNEQENAEEILSVYPVPARDQLRIQLKKKVSHTVELAIRNAQGQTIFTRKVDGTEIKDYTLYLNSLNLRPGVYFLQVQGHNDFYIVKPFVKQ